MATRTQRQQPLNQLVYQRLEEYIVRGEIGLGEKLDEQAVAEMLDVSLTPVRHAVAQLVKDGLLEHQPYAGNFVRAFTLEQLLDLYEVRAALEALAASKAAQHRTDDDLALLDRLVRRADECHAGRDMIGFALADEEFHTAVTEISRSDALRTTLPLIKKQVRMARHLANRDNATATETISDRHEIVDAIRRQDSAAAADLMRAHIDHVRIAAEEALDSRREG